MSKLLGAAAVGLTQNPADPTPAEQSRPPPPHPLGLPPIFTPKLSEHLFITINGRQSSVWIKLSLFPEKFT